MNNKIYKIIIITISMLTVALAQDPPDLPGAPNQGPIPGMIWLALSGLIIAAKKYFGNTEK
tara:strand:- start:559 stop:741 length:183 start_codon:yes stop_codon:yes gene_type:complete